nr:MAG TPA: hypothetical protein [Caudoviricetes sp.]
MSIRSIRAKLVEITIFAALLTESILFFVFV